MFVYEKWAIRVVIELSTILKTSKKWTWDRQDINRITYKLFNSKNEPFEISFSANERFVTDVIEAMEFFSQI